MQLDRPRSSSRFAVACTVLLAATLFGCDHATKAVATTALAGSAPVPVLGDLVVLRYVQNDDVAFSLMHAVGLGPSPASPFVLAALAAAALVALGVAWWRTRRGAEGSRLVDVGFASAFAGALGNVVDRVTHGYVVDFIHVKRWPVFNVADVLVVCGLALVVLAKHKRARLTV